MIGYDRRARRAVLDEVQPHWGAAAALVGAAISAYSANAASKRSQAASAASDVAQKGAAPAQQFQSVASQFAKPQGVDPNQRLSEGLAQENAQNEARLRGMQQGTALPPAPGMGAGAPPPIPQRQPTYMAGTQVQPGTGPEAYRLSNVPQTTQSPGMGVGDYANLVGTAAQVGGSLRQPPPPSGGLPQNPAPNYQPTAMEQLRQMLAMRQQGQQGRRYF
jgi:hypothetical protein